ncbi:hypothetical protein WISP_145044 [Willisornis vidua]|uniref:Uncharacterized protein n=1 Tax=Willisornis vidua TaxID=1566151 RepID=A0ABQ9CL68_9PASS|nr:hypothetical protein WISP_145044 [Willisornis vidua]
MTAASQYPISIRLSCGKGITISLHTRFQSHPNRSEVTAGLTSSMASQHPARIQEVLADVFATVLPTAGLVQSCTRTMLPVTGKPSLDDESCCQLPSYKAARDHTAIESSSQPCSLILNSKQVIQNHESGSQCGFHKLPGVNPGFQAQLRLYEAMGCSVDSSSVLYKRYRLEMLSERLSVSPFLERTRTTTFEYQQTQLRDSEMAE